MEKSPQLFLAPMAGYTDLPFRLLARELGADITVSEMISAKGLVYGDKKTPILYETAPEETRFGVQIFGSDPYFLGQAVKVLDEAKEKGLTRFDFIDFNAGCPAPKIVKNGDGSDLLNHLDVLEASIKSIKGATDLPVTVKARTGFFENENLSDKIIHTVEKAGADLLTLHPRTRSQFYTGKADWEIFRKAKTIADIPLVLSGDITSPEKAAEALELGADHLMIGRQAIENPFIFEQTKSFLENGTYREPTLEERIQAINRHIDLALEYKTSKHVIIALRKHLAAYTKGLSGASMLRENIFKATDPNEIKELFGRLL